MEAWKAFEAEQGSAAGIEKVERMMPIVSKKRRKVGDEGDMEEECTCIFWNRLISILITQIADWDMVFPDDERDHNPVSFKILEMAHKWKRAQVGGGDTSGLLRGLGAKVSTTESAKDEKEGSRIIAVRGGKFDLKVNAAKSIAQELAADQC